MSGLAAGCAPGYALAKDELPAIVQQARGGQPVVLRQGDRDLVVTAALEPTLHLVVDCSFWGVLTSSCAPVADVRLAAATWDGEALVLPGDPEASCASARPRRLTLDDIERAELQVTEPGPPPPRRFALGLAIAGPSVAAAIEFQWLPWRWLALEVGTLPAADMALGFAGARLRPVALGPVRPFVGGFANAWGAVNAETGETASQRAVGPRLGLDLELGSVLLTAELDGVRTFVEDQPLVGDLRGRWLLYGGGAASYRF